MIFNDTITFFHKTSDDPETWEKTIIPDVQWADKYEKQNIEGRISVARYASVTLPEGTYEGLQLSPSNEEDAIFYGEISETPTSTRGGRLSDLLKTYPRSGRIQSVNDNSNRDRLKNIKVVIG